MFPCARPASPVPQAPQLTKLLQQKSVFQVQHTPSAPKSQKSARPLRRRLSADEVLVRSNRSGRFKRRHSIKPPVQTKKRPIFILTDTEIQKNRCLSEPLGDLSLFVSRVGVPRQTTAPVRPAWSGEQDQHSNLFTPTFPGPYQVMEQSFFYPQSNESTSPQSVSSCQYRSASFDFDPNNEPWLDGSLIREPIRYVTPPHSFQTWPNTPESDSSSNDDLSSIEPSFSFDNYTIVMLKYQVRNSGTLTRPKNNRTSVIDDDGSGSASSNASASSATYLSWNQSLSPSSSSNGSFRLRGRSSSVSSLSSAGSSNESSVEWGPLKVHTGNVRAETDYKTLVVNTLTTAEEVVSTVLSKFRLTTRDPKLFRLTMEIKTKREGVDVTNVLLLERDAKPLELQRCHPKEMSRFVLQMGAGTLVRIFDFSISPESNYKSILVSRHTTCHEAVRLLLQMSRLPMAPEQFILVVVDKRDGVTKEYPLPREAVLVSATDAESETQQVHLRRFAQERLSLLTAPPVVASDSAPIHRFVRRNSTRRPAGLSEKPIFEMDPRAIKFEERCVL